MIIPPYIQKILYPKLKRQFKAKMKINYLTIAINLSLDMCAESQDFC